MTLLTSSTSHHSALPKRPVKIERPNLALTTRPIKHQLATSRCMSSSVSCHVFTPVSRHTSGFFLHDGLDPILHPSSQHTILVMRSYISCYGGFEHYLRPSRKRFGRLHRIARRPSSIPCMVPCLRIHMAHSGRVDTNPSPPPSLPFPTIQRQNVYYPGHRRLGLGRSRTA